MTTACAMEDTISDMVGIIAVCAAILLTAEFVRRCCRIAQDIVCTYKKGPFISFTTLNGKSLPARLQVYLERIESIILPWLDIKFLGTRLSLSIWLGCIALTIQSIKEDKSIYLTIFLVIYILFHDNLMLNPSFIENELTDGTNHIGPGLAVVFYSYIRMSLVDENLSEALIKYKEEHAIGGGRGHSEAFTIGHFITDRPVILCPDLPNYIENFEKLLEPESGKWCMVFTKGIVRIDQIQRKKIRERQWISTMAKNVSCTYEVSGTKRDSEQSVVRWEDKREDKPITYKYFRVIDNRPLDSMRMWYHDQKFHDVSLEELKNQYELFVDTLRSLLNKDELLKDKFYLLSFSGILSHELIELEKEIQSNEGNTTLTT